MIFFTVFYRFFHWPYCWFS